jgi:hypothetical protein
MTEVRFLVDINLVTPDDLREAAQDRGYSGAADDIAEMIDVVVINAEKAPLDTGFEIISSPVRESSKESVYTIDFHLRITDEVAFVTEARRRYLACWGQDDWIPESLSEAGYEILVASNGNPESPLDIGFEIAGTKYYADAPLSAVVVEAFSDDVVEPVVPGM